MKLVLSGGIVTPSKSRKRVRSNGGGGQGNATDVDRVAGELQADGSGDD